MPSVFTDRTREKAAETRARSKDTEFLASSVKIDRRNVNDTALRKYIESVPVNFRLRVVKALNGELSIPDHVRLKCAECCGFEDVANRVRDCTSWRCGLWAVRPYQGNEPDDAA